MAAGRKDFFDTLFFLRFPKKRFIFRKKSVKYIVPEYPSQERKRRRMAKLYFKYGAMGSSKTATALITKYNYEERGMRV